MIKRAIRLSGIEGGAPPSGPGDAGHEPEPVFFEASNGREALDLLETRRVDLIMADLNMPEMDGVEMIGRILAEPETRSIPVVIVSAKPDLGQITALRKAGARGYLRKPFTPEAVRDLLTRILEPTHV